MLERLNIFIGSTVLSVAVVFGAMYLAFGNWHASDLDFRTAATQSDGPSPQ